MASHDGQATETDLPFQLQRGMTVLQDNRHACYILISEQIPIELKDNYVIVQPVYDGWMYVLCMYVCIGGCNAISPSLAL